jgi:hypothetical protein
MKTSAIHRFEDIPREDLHVKHRRSEANGRYAVQEQMHAREDKQPAPVSRVIDQDAELLTRHH